MSRKQSESSIVKKRYISVDDAFKEILNFFMDSAIVEYDSVTAIFHHYLSLIEVADHNVFKDRVLARLNGRERIKMPYPSDLIRIENEFEYMVANFGKVRCVVDGDRVVELPVIPPKSFSRPPVSGRYELTYSEGDIITFQGVSVKCPFPADDLYMLLSRMRVNLQRFDVSAVSLQEFPLMIFTNKDLIQEFELLVFIYNVVEALVTDERRKKPELDYLFSTFLEQCLNFVFKAQPKDDIRTVFHSTIKNNKYAIVPELSESQVTIMPKVSRNPNFKSSIVDEIIDILANYFNQDQHYQLQELIRNGKESESKLIFLDNGCRLADTFKQLFNADLINGCEKQELCDWIARNFCYRHRQQTRVFKERYLRDIIATNKDKCHKPIINVKKGNIERNHYNL